MSEYMIMPKTKRMVTLAFFSLVFVMVGIFILASGSSIGPLIIGALTIIIFGLCFIYYVIVLIKREPAIIISNEGIIDKSSYIGPGLVRWDEIESFEFINFSGQLYLGIYTIDRDLVINRMSGIKKVFNQINKGLLETQVNIPVKNLNCSMDELVDAINERWEQANKKDEYQI
ncbi:STM3941 family protein [Lederbergia wuyishanensis]|uniref:PH domain-containing protein n=1 Tax=Lederbergia wuyishanensis TaxID=1347903 RepID=A0ABU0D719_9BACI|nr:STM3941 family protein [Lederbergia wuyishanensis]MCJ8008863.1 hypothetical protein [Lederbergia wuyishanensis]MDQ0344185.1 hypothetical protein [Lederbergia wuyishanensis]